MIWLAVTVSTSKLFLLLYVSHFLADLYFYMRIFIFIFVFLFLYLFSSFVGMWKSTSLLDGNSKFRPSAYSEFSIDNKNKEQAGMLPFGGSFLLTLDSLFSVVLL